MNNTLKKTEVYFNFHLFDYFLKSLGLKSGDVFNSLDLTRKSNFSEYGVSPGFVKKIADFVEGKTDVKGFKCVGDNSFMKFSERVGNKIPLFTVRFPEGTGKSHRYLIMQFIMVRYLLGDRQEDFCEKIGLSRQQVSNIETGNTASINVEQMDKLHELREEYGIEAWF